MNLRSILFACLAANGAQGTPQTVSAGEVGATIDVTLLRNGTVNADHDPYDVQGFAGAPWAGITYGGSDGGHSGWRGSRSRHCRVRLSLGSTH